MSRRPRLVYITTLPVTAHLLLRGQLASMREAGFDVHVVSSEGEELWSAAEREGVTAHAVPIPREVSIAADAVSLARLTRLLQALKPDIVNASTPKAGLLGMLAAQAAGVPIRIYLLRGLRLETSRGGLLRVLEQTERIASRCAHQVVCVSHSLAEAYVHLGHAPASKCLVLESGSSNGVNADRYSRTAETAALAKALRRSLGVAPGDPVIGFAGRMVVDKGIEPLLEAYEIVLRRHPSTHLLMVGDSLAGDSVDPAIRARVSAMPHAHVLPRMESLAAFYAALDVLAFPSFREGFPNVPVEAAAAQIPVVGFPSTGVVDAIVDGTTGTIVPRDPAALANGLLAYVDDPGLGEKHGLAGRERVLRDFSPARIWSAWENLYAGHLRSHGLPPPRPLG